MRLARLMGAPYDAPQASSTIGTLSADPRAEAHAGESRGRSAARKASEAIRKWSRRPNQWCRTPPRGRPAMNPWALASLLSAIATTALCVVAYLRDSRAALNRVFAWYGALTVMQAAASF